MIWWLVILGGILAILAAMYVPNWIRWARWNRRRRKATPGEQRDMIAPVPPPFWSSYGGAFYPAASGRPSSGESSSYTVAGGSGVGGGAGFQGTGASDSGFGAGAGFDGGDGGGGN
jgi:hypothetical protein